MKEKGISQESLKLIACNTMLIDHIGAVIVLTGIRTVFAGDSRWIGLYYLMRIIGRIAFPIYCFLLVEGAHLTRDPKKYALRLAIGALLAEIPFDLAFSGKLDFTSCSVMVTLLLGFLAVRAMQQAEGFRKLVVIVPFFLAAEFLRTDYAGNGIAIIAALELTRGHPKEKLLRLAGMTVLLWFGATVDLGFFTVPIEIFGLLSLIPIFLYRGRKITYGKAVRTAFYLFYPVHLLALYLIKLWIFG